MGKNIKKLKLLNNIFNFPLFSAIIIRKPTKIINYTIILIKIDVNLSCRFAEAHTISKPSSKRLYIFIITVGSKSIYVLSNSNTKSLLLYYACNHCKFKPMKITHIHYRNTSKHSSLILFIKSRLLSSNESLTQIISE